MQLRVRDAKPGDLEAVNRIYNHYVVTSTCTYQEEPATAAERGEWFSEHGEKYPVTVAVDARGKTLGWASLNRFHERSAYRFTVDNSIYVHPDHHRQGIGRLLLHDLLERARLLGHREIIAGISADQVASIALHARMGFVEAGCLRKVGYKFGKWLDVMYMQRSLAGA